MITFAHTASLAAAGSLALATCSPAETQAPPVDESEWTIDSDASRLSYISVKSGEIDGLPSITPAVPVTFSLVFEREK